MNEVLGREMSTLLRLPVQWSCSLKKHTSFNIGGPAEALVQVESAEELLSLLRFFRKNEVHWRVIGRGTNLLVRDEGYAGVIVILCGGLEAVAFTARNERDLVEVGAGYGLTKLSMVCGASGFSGLEFAMGIPGSIGGAVVMNAGAWGKSMADVLVEVTLMTAEGLRIYGETDLRFSYRNWLNRPDNEESVVTSAKIALSRKDAEEIRKTCSLYRDKRTAVQPTGTANAGSIFRNPPGDSAGRLIEASGLKEMKMGGAQVSAKHANFIINTGNATAAEVLGLMAFIQNKVQQDSGIFLEPEVHIL
jgi:UDP-N-acetylmuramate dehydrogenase